MPLLWRNRAQGRTSRLATTSIVTRLSTTTSTSAFLRNCRSGIRRHEIVRQLAPNGILHSDIAADNQRYYANIRARYAFPDSIVLRPLYSECLFDSSNILCRMFEKSKQRIDGARSGQTLQWRRPVGNTPASQCVDYVLFGITFLKKVSEYTLKIRMWRWTLRSIRLGYLLAGILAHSQVNACRLLVEVIRLIKHSPAPWIQTLSCCGRTQKAPRLLQFRVYVDADRYRHPQMCDR